MEKEMTYKAIICWRRYPSMKELDEIESMLKVAFNDLFVKLYNRAVNLVNPFYESWNKDYNADKHGEYETYILNHMNDVICKDEALMKLEPRVRAIMLEDNVPEICGILKLKNGDEYVCFVRLQKI